MGIDDSKGLTRKYSQDLLHIVDDHNVVFDMLAHNWPEERERTRLAMQRYLESYEYEVSSELFTTQTELTQALNAYRSDFDSHYTQDSLIGMMLRAKDIHEISSLYNGRNKEYRGVPAMLYINAAILDVLKSSPQKNPEKAVERISHHVENGLPNGIELIPVFRAAMDADVYKSAKSAKTMDSAKSKLSYA